MRSPRWHAVDLSEGLACEPDEVSADGKLRQALCSCTACQRGDRKCVPHLKVRAPAVFQLASVVEGRIYARSWWGFHFDCGGSDDDRIKGGRIRKVAVGRTHP